MYIPAVKGKQYYKIRQGCSLVFTDTKGRRIIKPYDELEGKKFTLDYEQYAKQHWKLDPIAEDGSYMAEATVEEIEKRQQHEQKARAKKSMEIANKKLEEVSLDKLADKLKGDGSGETFIPAEAKTIDPEVEVNEVDDSELETIDMSGVSEEQNDSTLEIIDEKTDAPEHIEISVNEE